MWRNHPRIRAAVLFLILSAALAAIHAPYLSLPFHWDEQGQFVPAALDLFRDGSWVTHSTLPNVHPPAVMALLALVWHIFGYSIASARLAMLAVAAAGSVFAYLLARRLGAPALLSTLFLLATSLFYIQSMMVLLDMPAMALTALALLLFLDNRWAASAAACILLVLTKETALTTPLVFAVWLWSQTKHRREALYFLAPAVALAIWLVVLHRATGYWLGNPYFGQYNVNGALHPLPILYSAAERFLFLFVKDGRFLGLIALYFGWRLLRTQDWAVAALVALAQLALVTVLGGAVLDRYLLPILPILYAAFATSALAYSTRTRWISHAALLTALVAGLFWNPPYPFQYEDNLAMVDFVDLQRTAAQYLESRAPSQRIASMWPFTGAIEKPDFGYLTRPLRPVNIDSFELAQILALDRRRFDVLVVYSRQYQMEGTWLDRPPLHALLQRLPGYHPQATEDELAAHGFLPQARWQRHGQWIEVYATGN
ncbi:MAG TPA: glycosyltransferase family 39 protein [Bryobacteraceae bacterium]|jgi:4-amino-4-deoxy-L-arabinose transferase-like glycosyltransferase